MILGKLCDLSRREGLLANPDYEPKAVAWIIAVGDGGEFLGVVPTSGESEGKKARAKVFSIPRRAGRTSAAAADFLVDKSEYVLGVEPDGKRSAEDLQERRKLFREKVRAASQATGLAAIQAVVEFLENDGERERVTGSVSAAGYVSNDLFAFQYRGELVHDLPAVQAYFSALRTANAKGGAQCLICGATGAPVDKHPAIKVPGGTTSGVALVSFNSDAFESYGMSRNENAPVCQGCADAYTTALNRLLSDRYPDPKHAGENLPKRFVRLSPDTTAVFWADEESKVLDLLRDLDAPRVESVGELLEAPKTGWLPGSVSSRFYCLILSGGQGRATLRGMHTGTVAELEQSLRAYFESIAIGSPEPLALWRLLASIVLQGKRENLPPELATDVFVAIVFGRTYPETLLARAVERCRAEQKVTRERAALLRSYLIRNLRWEASVGLDKENMSAGYRLGRLMAVLAWIQGKAQKTLNKTVVDKYYGSAGTRPATVFPRLLALAQHHLAKLPERDGRFFQKQLGEVLDGLAEFPLTLSMEDQGKFALGYYHQRQEFFKKTDAGNGSEGEEAA